ncbi:hypothetical protein F4604DRAFT_1950526 [Suillus subluteus]|nr:hypothetical protein F4604DRAFT_1950526 [Suillus subluteus]
MKRQMARGRGARIVDIEMCARAQFSFHLLRYSKFPRSTFTLSAWIDFPFGQSRWERTSSLDLTLVIQALGGGIYAIAMRLPS